MMGMIRDTARSLHADRVCGHSWLHQSDRGALTCRLDARENRSYEVRVVPHWDPASAIIECYDAPAKALVRHTEIAKWLRANGWVVIDEIVAKGIGAAPSSGNPSPFSLRGFDCG